MRILSDKVYHCKICGAEIHTRGWNAKYCDKCRPKKNYHRKKKKAAQGDGTVKCTEAVMQKCKYGSSLGSGHCCQYILIELKRRGCPAEACDKFVAAGERKKVQPIV